ncbi:MAG: T9SS type A sorting domain-containing protein [Bacteroidetes bacterium]|nr:T9SS type A sorting domain-containing protein [Bacteroidota bacterium]
MKKSFYTLLSFVLLFVFSNAAFSQVKLQEGFENIPIGVGNIPSGWSTWNNASFPIDPASNWNVQYKDSAIVGISSSTNKVNSGVKSIVVSWNSGNDTNGGSFVSDAWLVTKRISISAGDSLRFFAAGGKPNPGGWWDSLQVWVSIIDSTPTGFTAIPEYRIGSILFNPNSIGSQFEFKRYAFSLSRFIGQTVWIGFRYNTNCATQGYAVIIDDIKLANPNVEVQQNSILVDKFELSQNYPNPFNPTTNIKFSLPKATDVRIVVYSSSGQEIRTLVNEYKTAGSYNVDFNASDLASGTYFYKIVTSDFTETKKMTLVK